MAESSERVKEKWEKHGFACLAENVPTNAEDADESLELQRREVYFVGGQKRELAEIVYDLSICRDGEDLTFHGLTARKVCEIALAMINLVGGRVCVEAPPPPEIRF